MHLKYGIRHGLHDDDDFVGAKFYCPHVLADGNQHIRIREKMLEFSSTVLSTLSLYHDIQMSQSLLN